MTELERAAEKCCFEVVGRWDSSLESIFLAGATWQREQIIAMAMGGSDDVSAFVDAIREQSKQESLPQGGPVDARGAVDRVPTTENARASSVSLDAALGEFCRCGHPKAGHIYYEGACRIGGISCGCDKYINQDSKP